MNRGCFKLFRPYNIYGIRFCQVVHCGPGDTFAASLRGNVGVAAGAAAAAAGGASAGDSSASRGISPSVSAAGGAGGASSPAGGGAAGAGDLLKELNWASGPPMEVALLKQSEKHVSKLDESNVVCCHVACQKQSEKNVSELDESDVVCVMWLVQQSGKIELARRRNLVYSAV